MVVLIEGAMPDNDQGERAIWADLGAGGGNFTRALADLLPPSSTIYAIDVQVGRERDERTANDVLVHWQHSDFARPLSLPLLDGALMANALHFIPHDDQPAVLCGVCSHLRPGGRLVLVEYEPDRLLPYVPYPISFRRFESLTAACGLLPPVQIGQRRSPRSGVVMYAAYAARA